MSPDAIVDEILRWSEAGEFQARAVGVPR